MRDADFPDQMVRMGISVRAPGLPFQLAMRLALQPLGTGWLPEGLLSEGAPRHFNIATHKQTFCVRPIAQSTRPPVERNRRSEIVQADFNITLVTLRDPRSADRACCARLDRGRCGDLPFTRRSVTPWDDHHQADNSVQPTRILAGHWAWMASLAAMPPYAR
jgi:hypothetical protein